MSLKKIFGFAEFWGHIGDVSPLRGLPVRRSACPPPRGGRPRPVRKSGEAGKNFLEKLVHPIIIRFPDDPKHVWGCEQDGTVGYVIKNHNSAKSQKFIFDVPFLSPTLPPVRGGGWGTRG